MGLSTGLGLGKNIALDKITLLRRGLSVIEDHPTRLFPLLPANRIGLLPPLYTPALQKRESQQSLGRNEVFELFFRRGGGNLPGFEEEGQDDGDR
jgi:hypothetical protein